VDYVGRLVLELGKARLEQKGAEDGHAIDYGKERTRRGRNRKGGR
jgi:hypothetical protein